MNNIPDLLILTINSISCLIISYVSFAMLVESERPATWVGWLFRVCLASTAASGLAAAIFPNLVTAMPQWWTVWLRVSVAGAAFFWFQRNVGWVQHFKDQWNALVGWFIWLFKKILHIHKCGPRLIGEYVVEAKMCWNERVDRHGGGL